MGNKNGYLAKQQAKEQALIEAGVQCGKQQMVDYLTLVLRDPDYVGKDIFGRDRIEKVIAGLYHYEKKFQNAYTKHKEADVAQEHLDTMLREVWGDDLVPFAERQPDVLMPGYNKKKKGWVD